MVKIGKLRDTHIRVKNRYLWNFGVFQKYIPSKIWSYLCIEAKTWWASKYKYLAENLSFIIGKDQKIQWRLYEGQKSKSLIFWVSDQKAKPNDLNLSFDWSELLSKDQKKIYSSDF